MTYKMFLTSVKFDKTYKNAIRFNNINEQHVYFNIPEIFNNSDMVLKSFRFNNLLETSITYRFSEKQSTFNLLLKNYCIIEQTDDNGVKFYYYYFINSTNYDTNQQQIILYLSLDLIQNFYIWLQFQDSLIKRTHISRFIKNGDMARFWLTANSPFFISETGEKSKRLTERRTVKCGICEPEDSPTKVLINNFLIQHVKYYAYYYISVNTSYNVYTKDGDKATEGFNGTLTNVTQLPYHVICCPVMEDGYKIFVKNGDIEREISIQENNGILPADNPCEQFINLNNGESIVYAEKFSILPPNYIGDFSNAQINGKNLYLNCDYSENTNLNNLYLKFYYTRNKAVMSINNFKMTGNGLPCYILDNEGHYMRKVLINKYSFSISELITANKNPRYNPKLLSANFLEYNITNGINKYTIDIQKYNQDYLAFNYVEFLTPDITRFYCYPLYKNENGNNIFISDCEKNYTGLLASVDNSIPYSKNNLDTFLANNKNFYMQKFLSIMPKSLDTGALIGSGLNAVQSYLTIDNMRNAPETLQNANGNAYFSAVTIKPCLYLEIYEALDVDKEIENDYNYEYGYTYNKIGNIKELDHTRKYFNYIQADCESINIENGSLSNDIRDRIRNIFARGIRLWHGDIADYGKENYEIELEV